MPGGEQHEPPGRILLVEDDPVAAHYTMHVLRKRGGFNVTHTPDPAVALKRASSESWDLVLTDVELPGMTGLELLDALRLVSPDLPVAVVTAHESVDRAVRALRSRADEFLQKPVRPEELLAAVTSLVAKGRAARLARPIVLAIGAHPGDVEIGVAGTLLAHRGMGHAVSILTLTRGAGDGTESTRAGESQMAALVLGATLFLGDLPEARIGEGKSTIAVISGVVESVRPTVIYTHSFHDVRRDHRNTHRAAMEAGRQVGRFYCFQSPSATVDFRPTRFVNIDDRLERKLLAVGAFASQAEVRGYVERDLIKSTAGYWSRFMDGRYAEALEVMHEAALTAVLPGGPASGLAVAAPDGGTMATASGDPPRPADAPCS
jgi:CheY-like chemotaxis protein/LmbE family N-acetylglucosaminyl deacetylase